MDNLIEINLGQNEINLELPGGTRGLQGEQGIQGEVGAIPQFHIGTVEDTQTATASITGTDTDPILNLGLPRGRSGVWVGEYEPTDPDYTVWIDPTDTTGTYEEIGYTEHLTNKVFIDENNVRHPIYSKMFDLGEENTQTVTVDDYTGRGAAHGITNLDVLVNWKITIYSYHGENNGIDVADTGELSIKGQYLFVYISNNKDTRTKVTLEYTKSTQGGD